jgi:hypothetical protein
MLGLRQRALIITNSRIEDSDKENRSKGLSMLNMCGPPVVL